MMRRLEGFRVLQVPTGGCATVHCLANAKLGGAVEDVVCAAAWKASDDCFATGQIFQWCVAARSASRGRKVSPGKLCLLVLRPFSSD